MHCFSLIVVQHQGPGPAKGKYLTVEETRERGWWLPGGFVEPGDDFVRTAHKETLEEAGIEIKLLGILRVENSMSKFGGRQRIIFYAEPADPSQEPKSVADQESMSAQWLTRQELLTKQSQPAPQGLRGRELLHWATYLENGGAVYPLSLLGSEGDLPADADLLYPLRLNPPQ